MTTHPDIAAGWRPICSKRARKLRRRGEHVEWRPQLGRLAWRPCLWLSCPGCGHTITGAHHDTVIAFNVVSFEHACPSCGLYMLGDFT